MVWARACVRDGNGRICLGLCIHGMVWAQACVRGGSSRICRGDRTDRMEGAQVAHFHGHGNYHMPLVFHALVCGHDNVHICQDNGIDHRAGAQAPALGPLA